MTAIVVGIDPSQTGLGIVVVPTDWGFDWDHVRAASFGRPLKRDAPRSELIKLAAEIAENVCEWLTWAIPVNTPKAGVHVFMEAFLDKGGVFGHTKVVRIGSVVDHVLYTRLDLCARAAHVATVRKLLLGKLPRSDAKVIVQRTLEQLSGGKLVDGDQCDAFALANYGLTELGHTAIMAGAA